MVMMIVWQENEKQRLCTLPYETVFPQGNKRIPCFEHQRNRKKKQNKMKDMQGIVILDILVLTLGLDFIKEVIIH